MPDSTSPPLFILTKQWKHHSRSGGYHQLTDYLSPSAVVSSVSKKSTRMNIYRRKLLRGLFPQTRGMNLYSWTDAANEWKVIREAKEDPNGVIHALYAEDQLCFVLNRKHIHQNSVIGTFHMPADSPWFRKAEQGGALKKLNRIDAAIVVSRSMISDYEPWIRKENIFYVPHGIDTDVFVPGKRVMKPAGEKINLLIVGGHGRDWGVVKKTAEGLSKSGTAVEFKAVVPKAKKDFFQGVLSMQVLSGISEEKLISLYQEADVVFLPVSYATANNALLEAIACGTPVISTKTGGIPDYLDERSGWLLPEQDVQAAVSLIRSLADNRDLLAEKGVNARQKALQYSWEKVANQIKQVYNTISSVPVR